MADLQDELRVIAAVETGTVSDSPSLSALYHAALGAVTRALASDDERVSLRAAQVVLDHLHHLTEAQAATDREQVITITYGEQPPDGQREHGTYRNRTHAPSRPGGSPGVVGALQSGGVRTALGQDGDGQDRGD